MRTNHTLRRVRKSSDLGQVLSGTLLSAVMLLQPFGSAWAVDRLSTGQSWFVLNETGIDTLGVQRLRITGPDADAFAIEGYTGSPVGMAPSQDVLTPALVQKTSTTPLGVNLRFTPQHSGNHQAALEVTHDGSNASPVTYPLTGAGDWDVATQASTDMVDFGKRPMGMPAVTQDAFIRAVGVHGWLKVTGVGLEGSTDFTLTQTGLANKGGTTWGTGGNLEVLPVGATESTKLFTAADVSVGGLTDIAARVRYTPTLRGPQTATLTVYHDGPGGKNIIPVVGDGARAFTVELRGNSPYSNVTRPIADFARVGLNSTAQAKNIYLKASGTYGAVTYKGFKVEGSTDFAVTSAGRIYHYQDNRCVVGDGIGTPAYYQAISYPAPGKREDLFSLTGSSVTITNCSSVPGKDFGLTIRYTPQTLGKNTAVITIYHDGNDEGFTTFSISGEAFLDTSVALRGNSPYSNVTRPITDFPRVRLNSAAQTKNVYLRASGTYGAVTYKGFKVEGSTAIAVTSAGRIYHYQDNRCVVGDGIGTPAYYQAIAYPAPGNREDLFSLTGSSVTITNCSSVPGKDFGLTLRYTPNALGKQTATVTIYHDGNAQGFTTFDISGEAY